MIYINTIRKILKQVDSNFNINIASTEYISNCIVYKFYIVVSYIMKTKYKDEKITRDMLFDILQVLMDNKNEQLFMNSEEIKEKVISSRKKQKLPLKGVASSNVRRQLKRLRDIYLVENIRNQYRISEFEELHVIFKKQIKEFYLKNILERVEDYFKEVK